MKIHITMIMPPYEIDFRTTLPANIGLIFYLEKRIEVGLMNSNYGGVKWSRRDFNLILNHELAHADRFDAGIRCCVPFWYKQTPEEQKITLIEEKTCWRTVFDGLTYAPVDWLIKAQECMNEFYCSFINGVE